MVIFTCWDSIINNRTSTMDYAFFAPIFFLCRSAIPVATVTTYDMVAGTLWGIMQNAIRAFCQGIHTVDLECHPLFYTCRDPDNSLVGAGSPRPSPHTSYITFRRSDLRIATSYPVNPVIL